jgi:hypothetical protein
MKHNADGPQASEPTGEVPIRVLIAPLLPYPQFSDSSDALPEVMFCPKN